MTVFDWQSFLKSWSAVILQSPDVEYFKLPKTAIKKKWLGYDGATEAQILTAEQRLGTTLPPSYRAFLKASNGWRHTGNFIEKMLPVEKIYWFRDAKDKSLIKHAKIYIDQMQDIPYDPDYDTVNYDHFMDTLVIAKPTDEQELFLLNPKVKNEAGEWQAWAFAHWIPGAEASDSFQMLIEGEYETAHEQAELAAYRIGTDDDESSLREKLTYLIQSVEASIKSNRSAPNREQHDTEAHEILNEQADGMQEVIDKIIVIKNAGDDAKKMLQKLDFLVRQYQGKQSNQFPTFPSGQEATDLIKDMATIKDIKDPKFVTIMSKMFTPKRPSGVIEGNMEVIEKLRYILRA